MNPPYSVLPWNVSCVNLSSSYLSHSSSVNTFLFRGNKELKRNHIFIFQTPNFPGINKVPNKDDFEDYYPLSDMDFFVSGK